MSWRSRPSASTTTICLQAGKLLRALQQFLQFPAGLPVLVAFVGIGYGACFTQFRLYLLLHHGDDVFQHPGITVAECLGTPVAIPHIGPGQLDAADVVGHSLSQAILVF